MVTLSSILAWKIPWTEEPGRLHPMGWRKSQTQRSNQTTTTSNLLLLARHLPAPSPPEPRVGPFLPSIEQVILLSPI